MAELLPEIFVIMPFGNHEEYREGNTESNYVFDRIIKPGLRLVFGETSGAFNLYREVDNNSPGSISSQIIKNLARADIVIADLTGRNPNVFLELGVRFALRNKITILLAQRGTIPPFDVGDYRTIFYSIVDPEAAQEQIADAIREGQSERRVSDSLVFDTFSQISVVIPGYSESYGFEQSHNRNAMRWGEYWGRIEAIVRLLEGPATNGQFTPDAIIGISNGGLIAADLIGRRLFRGAPIVSLWANRFSRPAGGTSDKQWYFDNAFNNNLVDTIRTHVGDRRAVLLLLDDHLGTATTVRQAVNYFSDRFGDNVHILFIPMFSNRPEYIDIVDEVLPYKFQNGDLFRGLTKEGFIDSIRTNAAQFPYLKEISTGA